MLVRRLALLGLLALTACANTINADVQGVVLPKEALGSGYAAQIKPAPAAPDAVLVAGSGGNKYQIFPAAWNPRLARELSTQLQALGAQVDAGPEITVAVTGYDYSESGLYVETEDIDLSAEEYEFTVEIELSAGDVHARYKGTAEEDSPYEASWKAAGAAISQALADPDFRAAIKKKAE